MDRLPICSLTALSSSGFTSLDDVELEAGDLHAAVGDRDLAGEVGLDPPGRQQRRPRIHRDVAADVGALVEHAGGELLHFAAELVAEQAAERAGEIAALVGDLAGDAQRAVERGRDVQPGGRAVDRDRPARDGPADVGLAEQVGERIFVLAGRGRAGRWPPCASRIARLATATGAMISEVRVTGCSGLQRGGRRAALVERIAGQEAVERPQRAGEEHDDDRPRRATRVRIDRPKSCARFLLIDRKF